MKTRLIVLFGLACCSAVAETNYVLYSQSDGRVMGTAAAFSYDCGRDCLTLGDATLSGINWAAMRLDKTTNALPRELSNISQVASHTRVLPLTAEELTDFTHWGDERLEAVAKALMDLVNSRLPAGQQITEDQLKQAVRNRLGR